MVQTTIRIPEELYQRVKKVVREKGLSINAYVINLLWQQTDTKKNA